MIIDNAPKDPDLRVKATSKQPAFAEDLDRINQAAGGLLPALGLSNTCCNKDPRFMVRYHVKAKTILLNCPGCGKLTGEIKVAEKGSPIAICK